MIDALVYMTCRKSFKYVKTDNYKRCYAAQSVKYVVMWFGICNYSQNRLNCKANVGSF